MKKKLLILPLLALSLGTLSGCTKDDIKALQDKDAEQDSRLEALEGDVASLKSQIAALQAELAAKVQETKNDYNAKIDAANAEIAAAQAKLVGVTSNFAAEKAALQADYEAKIKAVDDKFAPYKAEFDQALEDLAADFQAALADLESQTGGDEAELQAAIDAINAALGDYQSMLEDFAEVEVTSFSDAVYYLYSMIYQTYQQLQSVNSTLSGKITTLTNNLNTLTNRVGAIETQMAEDKAAIQSDYNTKIENLTSQFNQAAQSLQSDIDDLQGQIDDLNDELNEYIQLLQDDYQSQINALTERIAALEDIPVYTVTFDPNYDFFNGDIAEPIEIEVLKGDKLNEADLDPEVYTQLDRPGNTLVQWNYEDTNREWAFFGYPVTQDMTLKAQWTPDSSEHKYDFANGFTFAREKLDQNGHVRYRCSEHGDACYFETQEKAGLFYIEDTFNLTRNGVQYTALTGKVQQGRLYPGQEVTVQLSNGALANYTIQTIEMFQKQLEVAVAGDNVGILFKGTELQKVNVAKGGLVCKANEAIIHLSAQDVFFHLYSEDEAAMYPDLGINARHTPVFTGYRPNIKYNANVSRVMNLSIIDSESEGMIMPGEDGIVKVQFVDITKATFFAANVNDNIARINVYESSNLIGYMEFYVSDADMVLLAHSNTENDFVVALGAENGQKNKYYLPDDDQLWDVYDEWNSYGGLPPYQYQTGWSRNQNSNNPEYAVDSYVNSDVSFTVYAIWEYRSDAIFSMYDPNFEYVWEDRGSEGMYLESVLVKDTYLTIANGSNRVCVDYNGLYHDGDYSVFNTYIDKIEVNGAYYEEYNGHAGETVGVYLRNVTDTDIMNNFMALRFDTVVRANISANPAHGGKNGNGQTLRSFEIAKWHNLPTFDQYVGPTHKLLGFSADPEATTVTYTPGATFNGTETQLYAIWGEDILSFAASSFFSIPGRGTLAVCDELNVNASLNQQVYVQLNDGTIKASVITGFFDPDTGRSIVNTSDATLPAGTQNVGVLLRGIDLSQVSAGALIWAKL